MSPLNIVLCMLIIFVGFAISFAMFRNWNRLHCVQTKLSSLAVRESGGIHDESVGPDGKMRIRHAEATVYDLADIENNRRDFNTAYADYVRNGQLIALLPLMGILGTVIGLITGTGAADIDGLVAGLGTAMWTTAIGLVFSIVLKLADAVFIGVLVNAIDADLASKDAVIERQILTRKADFKENAGPAPEAPK